MFAAFGGSIEKFIVRRGYENEIPYALNDNLNCVFIAAIEESVDSPENLAIC